MDLVVILNCLIHNLWEEMISYELQMHPWNHLFSAGRSECCICHWDHMELFCSEIGGRIILGFLVHMNSYANMQIPRMVCVISCLEPNQNTPLLWTEKRHKRHLIPLVRFIWGDSYLSNSPTRDNNEGGMGWVCTSGKGSFFLVPSSSPLLLSFHFSLLWLMLYSKLSLVKLIFFQRLQNRIHKGKSYETVKIDHNLDEIQMYSLLLSSL